MAQQRFLLVADRAHTAQREDALLIIHHDAIREYPRR